MKQVSLVIPVYNARETLPALLDSIDRQTLPAVDREVIVVDDGSTDGSADLVRPHPALHLVRQMNAGPGAARNAGTGVATGAVLAYTDADCVLPPDWLQRHVRVHAQHADIDGVCGGVSPNQPLRPCSSVLADHLCSWFNAHAELPEHTPEYLWSANMSVKRRVIDAGVAWSEARVTGEDVAFSSRMIERRMKLRFFSGLTIQHTDRGTLRGFLRHQYNWGFHAPFVRGGNRADRYAFAFPQSPLVAALLSPLVALGYTALTIRGWWRRRPLALLSALPLILLGKMSYARGVLAGTTAQARGSRVLIADRKTA